MDSISDLLEFAGEDDSLLSGGNSSTSANLFSCSPLVSIRSRPLQTAQPAEGIEITSVVSEDLTLSSKVSANDENSKCSKPEAPESQSQQKKRKKKFGGFNLRKSLAWDKAFFTEQGVLNPTELSMISGTATPNSKSNLEVIDEEELATTSIALQEIEENLFKHSSGGVSIRAKKIGAVSGLSPKPGASVKRTSPVASLAKRKVLATNNVGNKYKRSAIPRAAPSSSTDTTKTPSKESKITRIPGPKYNVSATTTRSGMLSSCSSKRNQNAHPGLSKNPTPSIPSLSKNPTPNIPRLSKNPTPSIPSLSKNPTYVPSIPKVDMADKCSVSRSLTKQAGKLSDNPVSILRPPSRMDQTGTIKSSGLRKPSPSIGFFSQIKASGSHSLQKSSIPCKPSESNMPKLKKLETVSVKEARTKVVKGAAKNTKELSLSDVKSEAIVQIDKKQMAGVDCDSSRFEIISKQAEGENILDDVSLKSNEQGALHENQIIYSMENMALPTHEKEFLTKNTKELSLSDVKSEAIVQIDKKQMAGVEVDCDSSRFEIISKQAEVENILDVSLKSNEQGALHENQIISSMENMALPTHEKVFLTENIKELSLSDVKSEAIVQIDKKQMAGVEVDCDSSRFEIISKQAEVENILDDVSLKSKEQEGLHENEIISSRENMALPTHEKEFLTNRQEHEQLEKEADYTLDNKLYDVSSNGDRSLYQEPQSMLCPIMPKTTNTVQNAIGQDEDDQNKGPTGDIPTFKENLILQAEFSGEFNKGYNSVKTALLNSSLDDFSKVVPEGSKQGTPCQNTEQVNCGADEFGRYEGDAQGKLLNESLSINCKKSTQSNLEAVNQQLQADQLKTLNHSGVEEIGPEKEIISDMNSSLPVHVTALFSKGSPEKSILGTNGVSDDESKIIEIKDCQLPVDDQSGFIPRSPMDKESDQIIDSKAIHDRTPKFELDRLSEDCITVSATACCINVTLKKKPFPENNVKNLHLTPPTVKASFDSLGNNMPINDSSPISESQTRDDNFSTKIDHTYRDVEESHEEDAQVQSINEIRFQNHSGFLPRSPLDKECDQVIDSKAIHDRTPKFELDRLSEDCITVSATACCINVTPEKKPFPENNIKNLHLIPPKVKAAFDSVGNNMPINDSSPISELQTRDDNFSTEIDHTYREIEESHEEDAQVQLINECPVAHDCSSKVCLAVVNDHFSLADDNNINEDSHLPGFQKPSAVVPVKSQDVHLDSDFLPTIIVSSSEIKDQNLVEDAFEGCGFHSNEHNASNHHSDMPVNIDGNHDVDGKVELMQINGVEDGSSNILPLVEIQLDDNVISAQFDSSTEVSEDPFTIVVALKSEEQCLLSENSKLLASDMPVSKDGNHDMDEKVEHLQINDVEDGNHDVDEKVEFLQINDVDEKVELLQIIDVDEKVELFQINDVDDKVELLQINDVDEEVELLQISDVEDGNHDVDEKVEHLQINDVEDGNHDVDEKVELLQINGAEDGNRDVDEKVELLQISDAEEGLLGIPPLVETQLNENFFSAEFYSSTEVSEDPFTTAVSLKSEKQCILSEKSKLLGSDMPVNKDGNQDMDEKVKLLQINGAEEGSFERVELLQINDVEDGNHDVDEKVELLQINDVDEKVEHLQINDVEDGNHDVDEKVELLQINGAEDGNRDVDEKVEVLQISEAEEGLLGILPLVETQLNENFFSAEFDSSTEVSEDPFTTAVSLKSEKQCILSEKSKLLRSDMLVNKDENQDVDEKVELFQINGAKEGSFEKVELLQINDAEGSLDISPSVVIQPENVIFSEFDSSTKVSEDPCLLSEKSKLLASENSIFNATIPQGSEVSSMKLNENAMSAELDSSIEVNEGPCLIREKSKLLASENSTFNATIPNGSKVSSVKLNENAIFAELDSSIEASESRFTSVVAWKPEGQCLLSEKSMLLALDNPTFIETIPQGNEVSSANSESFSDVAVTTVFENDKSPNTDMLSQTKDNIDFPVDNNKIIQLEIDATKTKQEVPIAKPPLNVAPFTEEWLAAIEAAGEEILTMKSGAVQNSPPDKLQNEPNPWSPVKKNQAIGPFDCTKHNIQSSDP